ncbi:MAG: TonB-dependent receptor [Salinivirgaceae bacterium]|jgi:TonB-linked SusC/RagA family outer membrane protein|nr:TonB-dependent receptor [Salinivirgaceae bacterium]
MRIGLLKLIRPGIMVVLLLTYMSTFAQNISVKGVITSGEDNLAIPGVNVLIKGTTTGTVTNLDGQFELNANEGDIVVFSFIGFLAEEVNVTSAKTDYSISLTPDLVDMDEVVVIGYGTQKKSDLTGAVVSVSAEELSRKTTATIEQAMQGLTAGVTVTANSGSPGEGAKVRIRGVGTVNNTDPLYVIDGVPVGGPGSTNPADIENISVLKDAAACAIYGARGANGVVIITTKKGKKGFHLNFDSQFGIQKEWKRLDLLDAEQYSMYINEAHYNKTIVDGRAFAPPVAAADPYNQPINTDWQDAMFQTAPIQKYNLAVSGANDIGNYMISGGYFNQQGIMLSTGYKKYYFRANSEVKWKRFRVGESFAFTSSNRDNEKNMVGGRNQIERMIKMTPNIPIYDTSQIGGYAGPMSAEHKHDAVNPVGVANMYKSNNKTKGFLGSAFAEAQIMEGLTYKFTFGFDYWSGENTRFTPVNTMGGSHSVGKDSWDTTFIESKYTLIENLLSYDKVIDRHHFNAIAGYTQERKSYQPTANSLTFEPAKDTTIFTPGKDNLYESGLVSYLGRVNYSFADKYLFQANIRRDGSSKFGEKSRWGIFPSYSGGWVVSKEAFMESLVQVSFLKIRASYGEIGNQNMDDYRYEASLNSYQGYVLNNVAVGGVGPAGFENPYVKWETSKQTNVGADLGFFDNRLNITTEFYSNTTEDMLIQVTMPESNGSTNFPWQNAGSVKNSGLELMVNYRNNEGVFKYSVTGNITTINNEVLALGKNDDPIYGGSSELGNATKTQVGQPIGAFYGYVTDGIYKSQAEIDAMNIGGFDESGEQLIYAPNATIGDIRFKDLNGDGVLSDEDRDFIGSAIPELTYGFNVTAQYRDFDLSVSFQGVYGNEIYRETKIWTEGMYSNFNATADVFDRYRPQDVTITTGEGDAAVSVDYSANTNTDMPWAVIKDKNNNAKLFSDRFIEDGSYLRLKDLTIGYNLPKSFLAKVKLSSVRVYFTGLNLLTFTKYSGFDPEIGGDNKERGIDNGYYPQAKAFLGGIQIAF